MDTRLVCIAFVGVLSTGALAAAQDTGPIHAAAASADAAAEVQQTPRAPGPRRDSLRNGILIGAAIGAVIGAIGADRCGNDFGCTGDTWQFLALGAAVGAGVGLGVDALLAREGASQSLKRPLPRFRVGARVGPRTRAIRASLDF